MEDVNDTPEVPSAQGQVEGSGNAVQGEQGDGQQQVQHSGFQKRIDELVAKSYEKDATINQLQQTMTELVGQLTRQQAAPQPQAPTNPFEGLDYTDPASVQSAFQRAMSQMEQKFSQQIGALAGQAASTQVANVATSWGINDAAIVQRAQQLAAAWRQQGYGFVPEDAVTFALGEAQRQGRGQPRDMRGRFSPPNPALGAANPAPPAPVQRNNQPLPANFDSLSPDAQLRILEARGADDFPL